MTAAAAPVPRPGPDVAERLAEAARDFLSDCEEWPTGLELAAALLPTVEAIAAERAAEELERLRRRTYEREVVVFGTACAVLDDAGARAAALRGEGRG